MPPHHQDEWVKLSPPDEFSVDNPANISGGRRSRLVRLDRDSTHFAELEQVFIKGWHHRKKVRPEVQSIFKVLWPEPVLEPYLTYRFQTAVRAKDKRGNEKLLFHGTNRACLLGESSGNVVLCSLKQCYLCSILRGSFDVSKCGKCSKNAFKRFGHGIYTTSCASKADDYVSNLSDRASLRVMLINRVVVGKPYKKYRNSPDIVSPPYGYDSIAGEIGWDLNYEETVTYHNDTVRPAYLVIYGNKPQAVPNLKAFVQAIFKTPIVS
ncbi:ADP-ribosylation [Melanogaster broomeanus]|nr:ADP-ribosylation [Melanogaster broomeanus]